MAGPAPIQPLPPPVASRLRAQCAVPDLAAVVAELAANAVDAGAGRIEIAVDPEALAVTVHDDGCGIPGACFARLATHAATSKAGGSGRPGRDALGYRGEALACIADLAVLDVTSRAVRGFETHTKLVKAGRVLSQGLALQHRARRGTTVVVRDFLHNQPVRRRQMLQSR